MDYTALWEILVPTMMNDKPVRTKHHKEWDKLVNKISKGLTIGKPEKGYWISYDNQTVEERVIPVKIVCTKSEIEQIADITAKHYKQDAVMFYMLTEYVTIKRYKK